MPSGGNGSKVIPINRPRYGEIAITQRDLNDTNPVNNIPVVAHPSGTDVMNPPVGPVPATGGPYNGYYIIPGYIESGANRGVEILGGGIVVPEDGDYIVAAWGGFRHSQNNSSVSFIMCAERNGQALFNQQPSTALKPTIDRVGNVYSGGTVSLLKGDILKPCVASNVTGTVTLGNSIVSLVKLNT